jgi:hypothetical protein
MTTDPNDFAAWLEIHATIATTLCHVSRLYDATARLQRGAAPTAHALRLVRQLLDAVKATERQLQDHAADVLHVLPMPAATRRKPR